MTDAVVDAIGSLTRRIRQLEAADAARSLLARYGSACDARDLDAVTAMFGEDGRIEVDRRIWVGRQQIASFFQDAWAADPSDKTHFIVNVSPGELTGGSISVRSTFLYTAAGASSSVIGWGRYRDVVDVAGPEPVFLDKGMDLTWAGDVRWGWTASGPGRAAPRS